MQALLDKWGLPALAVIIGGIILWGLIFAPRRVEDGPKVPAVGTSSSK